MIQNPPNAGILSWSVRSASASPSFITGFDISGLTGVAYAAFQIPGGPSQLYTISLTTGAATLVGGIGTGQIVRGPAAPVGVAAVPEPATLLLVGSGALALRWRKRARSSARL
jgi:Domain of unknown function (DUF4394)/PEP-CTERM motif